MQFAVKRVSEYNLIFLAFGFTSFSTLPGIASETWNMNRVQMSQDSVAELECQVPDPPHYIRCAQVFPGLVQGSDVRFAVGQASGKVTLMSFDEVS